jgi:hypothetical protein
MGSSNSKTELITRPGQSGKDRRVLDLIREDQLTRYIIGDTDKDKITIIFHGLTKSLGSQKSARLATEKGFNASKILLWNSSGKGDSFTEEGIKHSNCSPKELFSDIITEDIEYILCCDNKRRWDYVQELCATMDRYIATGKSFPGFRIVIDEADDRLIWHNYDAFASVSPSIKSVLLVTATPEKIVNKYDKLTVSVDIKPIDPEFYVGCADQDFVIHDLLHADAMEYVATLFAMPAVNARFTPGSIWFVPADIEKDSHNSVEQFFLNHGANVAIVNGERKEIVLTDGHKYDLRKEIAEGKSELGQILKRYRLGDPRLSSAPFVVTGNMCIERGISFQDSREGKFLFDVAIVANETNPAKAYQMMCRMFGNIRKVRGDHRATIFTTTAMKDMAQEQENMSIEINRIAGKRSDKTINKSDIKQIKKGRTADEIMDLVHFVCDDFDEAKKIAAKYWGVILSSRGRDLTRAPDTLRKFNIATRSFENPTVAYLLKRRWGLDDGKKDCRAYPTNTGEWCVYGYLPMADTSIPTATSSDEEDYTGDDIFDRLFGVPVVAAGGAGARAPRIRRRPFVSDEDESSDY